MADRAAKTPEQIRDEKRQADRDAELAQQEHVRQEVWAATHNDDGTPKPIIGVILP